MSCSASLFSLGGVTPAGLTLSSFVSSLLSSIQVRASLPLEIMAQGDSNSRRTLLAQHLVNWVVEEGLLISEPALFLLTSCPRPTYSFLSKSPTAGGYSWNCAPESPLPSPGLILWIIVRGGTPTSQIGYLSSSFLIHNFSKIIIENYPLFLFYSAGWCVFGAVFSLWVHFMRF